MSLHLIFKITVLIAISIIIRGVLPRYRVDQLVSQNWKFFIFVLLSFFFVFTVALAVPNTVSLWHRPINLADFWIIYDKLKPYIITTEFWLDIYHFHIFPKIYDLPFIPKIIYMCVFKNLCIFLAYFIDFVATFGQFIIDC